MDSADGIAESIRDLAGRRAKIVAAIAAANAALQEVDSAIADLEARKAALVKVRGDGTA